MLVKPTTEKTPVKKREAKRAWSVDDILKKVYKTLSFSKPFFEAFKNPQSTGLWFIWGESGSGKSSFILQLITELAKSSRVVVNDLEEADDMTVQDAFKRFGLQCLKKKLIWCSETMEEFAMRMESPKAPKIMVINSFQYMGWSFAKMLAFKRRHKDKLIIIVSGCDGKQPDGRAAKSTMKDASLKIWVEGYKAFSKGRYIGENGGVYVIWKEGAELYHGVD